MIKEIFQHLRRLFNARHFGVPFFRRSSFKTPKSLRVDDKVITLFFPDEDGIKNDFLTCLIEDEYGLRGIYFNVKTIVDIGSNVGFFSIAARAHFPNATIHAYEPNPRILYYAEKNAEASNFKLYKEAVGETAGLVSMEDEGDSNQATTFSTSDAQFKVIQVTLTTVVERIGGSVDSAKIDCEGAEWELFKDTSAWKHIKNVRMEYHLWGKHTYKDVEESLRSLGFEVQLHRSSGEWGTVWARNINKISQ